MHAQCRLGRTRCAPGKLRPRSALNVTGPIVVSFTPYGARQGFRRPPPRCACNDESVTPVLPEEANVLPSGVKASGQVSPSPRNTACGGMPERHDANHPIIATASRLAAPITMRSRRRATGSSTTALLTRSCMPAPPPGRPVAIEFSDQTP